MNSETRKPVPFATIGMIVVTLVCAAFVLGDRQMMWSWGFIPKPLVSTTMVFRIETAFTSLFIHIEPMHLLGNMLILAAVGPVVEAAAGAGRFVTIYLVSGMVGVAAHAAMCIAAQPRIAGEPLVGASACVAGLIGYSWLRFYRSKVPIFPKVQVPVAAIVVVWVALQIFGGLAANAMFGAPIAYWSHVGGFLTGFLLAIVFRAGRAAHNEAWRERLTEAEIFGPAAQVAAAKEYLAKHPDDLPVAKALIEALLSQDRREEAIAHLQQLVAENPSFDSGYAVSRLIELGEIRRISSQARLRLADQIKQSSPNVASLLADSVLAEAGDAEAPNALLILLEISASENDPSASTYASLLRSKFSLSPQTDTAQRKWPHLFPK